MQSSSSVNEDAPPTLLDDVEAFLRDTGMSARRFGKCCCNDGSFIDDLRKGRDVRTSTVSKVRAWMTLYRRDPAAALGQQAAA